ncbi:uncharacterized protein BDR25DRAFT_35833 [Lindgomyces ingoldianus]|uniref:Uncharacterized protein n=1 Tax=Lindgomyces ingoldianus TaxID=673940 RepID=A0ACB6QSI2_9PLEO|nr:uncharacterized protein BDR25DRAFT_35833 [Lindgomyces ingoldianus]KAF2469968.1 hypothetical protein BDR25DRAFT_35833 [Lindgomyces ingoldianus]
MSLSPVEQLPLELLQDIFLQSGPNLALPAASHHIAAKLSNDYCYHATCTEYLTQNLDSRVEQSRAQTRIFSYKWMTWEYFQAFVNKTYASCGCLCGKTQDEGCFDPIWPPDFQDATNMVFSRSHLPALSFIKCRLPVKLLHGPWERSKIHFLRFLLWTTSMTVDWGNHDARKLALEGKKQAILDRNLEVVELFNHNRRLGKAPGLDMVRFTVIQGGCDRSIVYDTMSTARTWGLRGDGWRDLKLDQWCKQKIAEGDPKGKWLKLKLEELRTTHGPVGIAENGGETEPRAIFGYMHPKSGDYDNVEGDKLVITPHKWNQLCAEGGL